MEPNDIDLLLACVREGASVRVVVTRPSDGPHLKKLAKECADCSSLLIVANAGRLSEETVENIAKAGGRNVRLDFKA